MRGPKINFTAYNRVLWKCLLFLDRRGSDTLIYTRCSCKENKCPNSPWHENCLCLEALKINGNSVKCSIIVIIDSTRCLAYREGRKGINIFRRPTCAKSAASHSHQPRAREGACIISTASSQQASSSTVGSHFVFPSQLPIEE